MDRRPDFCLSLKDVRAVRHVTHYNTGDDSQGQLPHTAFIQQDDSHWFSVTVHVHKNKHVDRYIDVCMYVSMCIYICMQNPHNTLFYSLFSISLDCVIIVSVLYVLFVWDIPFLSVILFIFCFFLHPVSPFYLWYKSIKKSCFYSFFFLCSFLSVSATVTPVSCISIKDLT